MAPYVDFSKVKPSKQFEPLLPAKYPCVLSVDNLQRDTSGEVMKDAEGNPAIRKTKGGDEEWKVKATILDGKFIGRWIYDQFSFGPAVARVQIVFKRAGIIEGTEGHQCEPEELDGTYWWVELAVDTEKDGTPKLDKYGKQKMKVPWAGYELMDPKQAKHYRESYKSWEAKQNQLAQDNGDGGEDDDDKVPF